MNRAVYINGVWTIVGIAAGTFAVSRFDSRTLKHFDTSPIESALEQGTLASGSELIIAVKPRYFVSTTDGNGGRWTELFYDDRRRMYWMFAYEGKLYALRQFTPRGPEWVFKDDGKVVDYFKLRGNGK